MKTIFILELFAVTFLAAANAPAAGGDSAQPGTVAGALGKRAGDFVEGRAGGKKRSGPADNGAEDPGGLVTFMSGGASLSTWVHLLNAVW